MIPWMIFSALCAVALSVAGSAADIAIGRRGVPRRAIWFVLMVASAGVPVVMSFVAHRSAGLAAAATSSSTSFNAAPDGSDRTDLAIVIAWGFASVAIMSWLFAVHARLRRHLRACARTTFAGATPIISPDFGPAVVGVFRPEIVLPEWSLKLTAADRALVLRHEIEHTRAFDPAVHLAGLALAVLMPWNLALWWQLSRLRLAIEIDCDGRVVAAHGEDPARYGQLLLDARALGSAQLSGGLALTLHRSALGRRIEALMTRGRRPTPRTIMAGMLAAGVVTALGFVPAPPIPQIHLHTAALAAAAPAGALTRQNVIAPMNVMRAVARPKLRAGSAKGTSALRSAPHASLPGPQLTRVGTNAALMKVKLPVPPQLPVTRYYGGAVMIGRPPTAR